MYPWLQRLQFAVLRYLPAEVAGTAVMLAATLVARQHTHSIVALTVVAIVAESAGFYAVITTSIVREQPQQQRSAARTARLLIAEFGPAEVIDTFSRAPITAAAIWWLGPTVPGVLVGKVVSDLVFYAFASGGYAMTYWFGWRGPGRQTLHSELRDRRLAEVRELLVRPQVVDALGELGTPLAILEPQCIRDNYRRLRSALPFVRFHYAVKAQDHPEVIDTVADEGGWFDVASQAELDLVLSRGVGSDRIIHTHPVKSEVDIATAVFEGVQTFVVDSRCEVDKFARLSRPGVGVLVRLAFRNPAAASDVPTKFGVDPQDAVALVRYALGQGVDVRGFSFHVGSQLDAVQPYVDAVARTLRLTGEVEAVLGHRMAVLDIGGGFPVAYRSPVVSFEQIAEAIGPLLAPLADRMTILAEPGRFVVADSMTAVTAVAGVSKRAGQPWYYVDDGAYGLWSNIVWEHVSPMILTGPDLRGESVERLPAVIAGPTCDSVDVLSHGEPVPELRVGDLVVSPTLGAYSSVTSTTFNGLPRAPVLVLKDDYQPVPKHMNVAGSSALADASAAAGEWPAAI